VPYAGSQSNNTGTFERYLIEEIIRKLKGNIVWRADAKTAPS
jgi:hypothetical protein